MRLTDKGALLISVNRHNLNFNGTICTKPISNKCGAQDSFRKNCCSKERLECKDMRLFAQDGDAYVYIRNENIEIFDKAIELLNQGYNPIIFFYTSKQKHKTKMFYVVGLYIVKEIKISEEDDFWKRKIKIIPERFVSLPLDIMSNRDLWENSSPAETDLYWIRNVYSAAVVPALETIQRIVNDSDFSKYRQSVEAIKEIVEHFNNTGINEKPVTEKGMEPDGICDKDSTDKENHFETLVEKKVPSVALNKKIKEEFESQIHKVRNLASEEGFFYSEKMIRMICSNIVINPLLILAGISGSGKSSFAVFYANAVGGELEIVSVRPDWTNPSHLLGVYNPFAEDFIATPVTNFIKRAQDEWECAQAEKRSATPYILVLDEMNLARVEYYFSDFLSKMQVADKKLRKIRLYNEIKGEYPREITITDNLKIIGTVNIDETTFLFSPKVLDRAAYINLNEIDIDGMGKILDKKSSEINNLSIIHDVVIPELKALNYKLTELDQPFGYRTVWDIVQWIDYSLSAGNIESVYDGIDLQIENRILSKLVNPGRNTIFTSLKSYFEDRNGDRSVYERCLQRLELLINRTMRDEYAIGQQY